MVATVPHAHAGPYYPPEVVEAAIETKIDDAISDREYDRRKGR